MVSTRLGFTGIVESESFRNDSTFLWNRNRNRNRKFLGRCNRNRNRNWEKYNGIGIGTWNFVCNFDSIFDSRKCPKICRTKLILVIFLGKGDYFLCRTSCGEFSCMFFLTALIQWLSLILLYALFQTVSAMNR